MTRLLIWVVLQFSVWLLHSRGVSVQLLLAIDPGFNRSDILLLVTLLYWSTATAVTVLLFFKVVTLRRLLVWGLLQALAYGALNAAIFVLRDQRALTPDALLYARLAYLAAATLITHRCFARRHRALVVKTDGPDPQSDQASFNCQFFHINVDFAARTARIRGRRASWSDGRKALDAGQALKGKGTVDFTVALAGLQFRQQEQTKTHTILNSATGYGTGTAYVEGQPVTVTAPVTVYTGGATTYNERLGTFDVTFTGHNASVYEVVNPSPRRAPSGELLFSGRVQKKRQEHHQCLSVGFSGVPGPVMDQFRAGFWSGVQERIQAIEKSTEEALLTESNAEHEKSFLAKEASDKALADQALAAARAEAKALREAAGVQGEFSEWRYDADGKIRWYVSVDRSGAALIVRGEDRWHGRLQGAKVTIETSPANNNDLTLQVEVSDPAFERLHLQRRRFLLMPGFSRQQLTVWVDRIEILARQ